MTTELYNRITTQISAELARGVRPWAKPWDASHAAGPISIPLRHNGTPYTGINVLMLWASAMQCGYTAPIWITYKQAQALGGHVSKGAKGTQVVYANKIVK